MKIWMGFALTPWVDFMHKEVRCPSSECGCPPPLAVRLVKAPIFPTLSCMPVFGKKIIPLLCGHSLRGQSGPWGPQAQSPPLTQPLGLILLWHTHLLTNARTALALLSDSRTQAASVCSKYSMLRRSAAALVGSWGLVFLSYPWPLPINGFINFHELLGVVGGEWLESAGCQKKATETTELLLTPELPWPLWSWVTSRPSTFVPRTPRTHPCPLSHSNYEISKTSKMKFLTWGWLRAN